MLSAEEALDVVIFDGNTFSENMNQQSVALSTYIKQLPDDRQLVIRNLRDIIVENLPDGFEEQVSDMIHYQVPLTRYPDGYHCKENTPLPYMSLASQKNFVAVYHMGIYADPKLNNWFMNEYHKYARRKSNMGKGCIRFTAMDDVPYKLVGRLAAKMTVMNWIRLYEKKVKK